MINLWTDAIILFSFGPLKILAYCTCQQDISKSIFARDLKLSLLIGDDK